MGMVEELNEFARRFMDRPVATELKVHSGGWDWLRAIYGAKKECGASTVESRLFGINVYIDDTMPTNKWVLVDRDGNILHEGTFDGGAPNEDEAISR